MLETLGCLTMIGAGLAILIHLLGDHPKAK
jgi:hypothetical protein